MANHLINQYSEFFAVVDLRLGQWFMAIRLNMFVRFWC